MTTPAIGKLQVLAFTTAVAPTRTLGGKTYSVLFEFIAKDKAHATALENELNKLASKVQASQESPFNALGLLVFKTSPTSIVLLRTTSFPHPNQLYQLYVDLTRISEGVLKTWLTNLTGGNANGVHMPENSLLFVRETPK